MSKRKACNIPRTEEPSWEEAVSDEGRAARLGRKPRESCPAYITGREIWLEGWDRADQEYPKARAAAE
jgi:hypothetical protein